MSQRSVKRIQNDIKLYFKSDLNDHGIYVNFNDKNILNAKALIIGPDETPYKNGFYFFDINYTEKYPQEPPKVLLCTLNKRTRFNPNLYTGGKVCLSILGTWSGPGWTPCLSTCEVLLSIQSLMNKNPIVNEPGYENLTIENSLEARKYIKLIEFHNHLVAVVQMIDHIPPGFECFKELIESKFCELYKENIDFIRKKVKSSECDKEVFLKMYSLNDKLSYKYLLERYEQIYKDLSIVYCDNSAQTSTNETESNDIEQTSLASHVSSIETASSTQKKIRIGPEIKAADFEVGYLTTFQDREYIVKEVSGKGGAVYKRWILKK